MSAPFLRLGQYRWLHRAVAALRIVPIANLILGRFPLERRLKPSNLVYRVTSVDQFSVANGVLRQNEYGAVLDAQPVDTLIDLGCNAGWFTLWLDARTPNSRLRGLLIDANPRMVADAAWHIRRNGLGGCTVVHGAVGLPAAQSSASFHIHPSSSASSVLSYDAERQLPVKGKIIDLTVPAVSVASEWDSHFGASAVDLMKIDIEGMELELVINEGAFLRRRVRRLVMEWHKWCVSFAQLNSHLESIGFELSKSSDESDLVGLTLYKNTNEVV